MNEIITLTLPCCDLFYKMNNGTDTICPDFTCSHKFDCPNISSLDQFKN